MSPRILIAVVIALVVGLLLGRTGPQGDLRRANEEIAKLRGEIDAKSKSRAGASLSGMKNMLKVSNDDLEAGAKARRTREAAMVNVGGTNGAGETAGATMTNGETITSAQTTQDRTATSNNIERMKAAWAMRADIARSNFVARAKLDVKGQQDFSVLVEAMNLRIGSTIDKWATVIRQKNEMTPELGVRMMTELGDAVVLTYDEFDRVLPPTWREGNDGKFEMVDFIDPEVLTPLQDLDGIIKKSESSRQRNGPRGPFGGMRR